MKRGAVSVALLLVLLLNGCGYHVAGHYNTLPKSIHTIAVPALENKTATFRIEQRLTAATIHEFLAKTTYKIVSNPADADAVLTGKVLSVEAVPLTFQSTNTTTSSTAQATNMLITMRCEVTFTERATDKVLYHTSDFLFRGEYELATGTGPGGQVVEGDVKSFFQESDPAYGRMARDFASRLVAAVTENY